VSVFKGIEGERVAVREMARTVFKFKGNGGV